MSNVGAAKYSETMAALENLKKSEQHHDEIANYLLRLLQFSELKSRTLELLQGKIFRIITVYLLRSNQLQLQRLAASIILNISQTDQARVEMCQCTSWSCLSYRHNCPLFNLLFVGLDTSDILLKRICIAGVINCSYTEACQSHLDTISGLNMLLKLLDANDEIVAVYAASALWNICKRNSIVLKIETVHGVPRDVLQKTISRILWTRSEQLNLYITESNDRGLPCHLDSLGANRQLVLTTSINNYFTILLAVSNYDPPVVAQPMVEVDNKANGYKSIQKFDETGTVIATTCAMCSKTCKMEANQASADAVQGEAVTAKRTSKNPFMVCGKDNCHETYHLKCSRWKHLDRDLIEKSVYYCDVCVVYHTTTLQYADFVANEGNSGSSLISKLDFENVVIERHGKMDTMVSVLNGNGIIIGLGKWLYSICNKTPTETIILKIMHSLIEIGSIFHAENVENNKQTGVHGANYEADWKFSFIKSTKNTTNSVWAINALQFWPKASTVLYQVNPRVELSVQELEQAFLYSFEGLKEQRMFAYGNSSQTELWSPLLSSQAKCMKMLTKLTTERKKKFQQNSDKDGKDHNAANTKRKIKKKPHIERKLSFTTKANVTIT